MELPGDIDFYAFFSRRNGQILGALLVLEKEGYSMKDTSNFFSRAERMLRFTFQEVYLIKWEFQRQFPPILINTEPTFCPNSINRPSFESSTYVLSNYTIRVPLFSIKQKVIVIVEIYVNSVFIENISCPSNMENTVPPERLFFCP